MRTDEEILARIEARRDRDPLGFEWPYYLACLPFDLARKYLNDQSQANPSEWNISSRDADHIRKECAEYMAFAWDKANGCRGISATRSISHYQAWLWLLGEDSWGDKLFDDYEYYGKPQLVRICEFLGLDSKQWDDGIRTNG